MRLHKLILITSMLILSSIGYIRKNDFCNKNNFVKNTVVKNISPRKTIVKEINIYRNPNNDVKKDNDSSDEAFYNIMNAVGIWVGSIVFAATLFSIIGFEIGGVLRINKFKFFGVNSATDTMRISEDSELINFISQKNSNSNNLWSRIKNNEYDSIITNPGVLGAAGSITGTSWALVIGAIPFAVYSNIQSKRIYK